MHRPHFSHICVLMGTLPDQFISYSKKKYCRGYKMFAMYTDEKTTIYFLSKLKERLREPILAYLLTVEYAKKDEDKRLQRFYTLKNALDYVFNRDPNALALGRERLYSDGKGYYTSVIIITTAYIDFKEFVKFAKQRALIWAFFHIEFVEPKIEDILRVTGHVIRNKEEVNQIWKEINSRRR